jgi:hypothetical protein
MQVLSGELPVHKVVRYDGTDVGMGEMAIAERTWPDGEIGAVITTALTATRADLAGCIETRFADSLFEGVTQ